MIDEAKTDWTFTKRDEDARSLFHLILTTFTVVELKLGGGFLFSSTNLVFDLIRMCPIFYAFKKMTHIGFLHAFYTLFLNTKIF